MPDSERTTFTSTESISNAAASDRAWANEKPVETHSQSIGLKESVWQEKFDPVLLLDALEKAKDAWEPPEKGGNLVKVVDYRNPDWRPDRALEVILTIRQHNFKRELETARKIAQDYRKPSGPAPTDVPPITPESQPEAVDPVLQEKISKYGQFTVEANFAPTTFVGKGKGNALEIPLLGASEDDIDNYVLGISIDERYGNLNLKNVSRWNNIRVAIKLPKTEDEELPKGVRRTDDEWVTFRLGNDRHMGLSGQQRKFLNTHLLQSEGLSITIDQSNLIPRYSHKTRLPQKSFRIISEPNDWKVSGRRIESMVFRQEGFSESDIPSVNVVAPEPNIVPVSPPPEANTLERSPKENETYRDILATNDDALQRNAQITSNLEKLKLEVDRLSTGIEEVGLDRKVRVDCRKKPEIVIGGNIAKSEVYLTSVEIGEPEATEWINLEPAEDSIEDAALSLVVEGPSILPTSLSDRHVTFIYRDRKKPGNWESLDVLSVIDEGYSDQQKQIAEITAGLKPHNFRFEVESTDEAVEAYEINFTDLKETETDNNPRITDLTFFIHKREGKNTP